MLTPAEVEARTQQWFNHPRLCHEALRIKDKFGQSVPMKLTTGQLKLAKAIDKQRSEGKPVRVIVLKGRQTRISAGAATELFRQCAFLGGQKALSVAHLLSSAANIWSYVDQYDASYQTYAGVPKLRKTRRLTPAPTRAGMLGWGGTPDNPASVLTSATAKSVDGGRSASVRHLHLSEFAFYENAAAYMTGLIPSVPPDAFTTIIIESTANGRGGAFYRMWQEAVAGVSDYMPVFVPWFDEKEYTARVEPGFVLTQDEHQVMTTHALTMGQMLWRRKKIIELGSEDAFKQEFPATPEEAFLTSGRPRFNQKSLAMQVRTIEREPIVGDLELQRNGIGERLVFVPNETGRLKLYSRPQPGKKYTVGADPSKGIDVAEKGAPADPDWSVANVGDDATGETVAVFRERLTPHAFAEYVAALCRWYNNAFLCPEANELGFIEALVGQYPIEHIYVRNRDADDRRPPTVHELGWYETGPSRLQLISTLDGALREASIVVRDSTTLDECYSFVYKATGRAEHEVGCHDDCVFALALRVEGRLRRPSWVAAPQVKAQSEAEVIQYGSVRRRRGLVIRDSGEHEL